MWGCGYRSIQNLVLSFVIDALRYYKHELDHLDSLPDWVRIPTMQELINFFNHSKAASLILDITSCDSVRYHEFIEVSLISCLDNDCPKCSDLFKNVKMPVPRATRMAMPPEHRASLTEAKRLWIEPFDAAFFFQSLCGWKLNEDFELHLFYDASRCTEAMIKSNLRRSSADDFKIIRAGLEPLKIGLIKHFEASATIIMIDDSEAAYVVVHANETNLVIVDPHLLDPSRVVRIVDWDFIFNSPRAMWMVLRFFHTGEEFIAAASWTSFDNAR